jgi:hypothetical protein
MGLYLLLLMIAGASFGAWPSIKEVETLGFFLDSEASLAKETSVD